MVLVIVLPTPSGNENKKPRISGAYRAVVAAVVNVSAQGVERVRLTIPQLHTRSPATGKKRGRHKYTSFFLHPIAAHLPGAAFLMSGR